jgi:hypothetical protein
MNLYMGVALNKSAPIFLKMKRILQMKNLVIVLLLISGFASASSIITPKPTPDAEKRAVAIKYLGGFTGFDADGYKVVRSAMASLVVEGVVDHFVTTSWGFEGGNDLCVELNPDPAFSLDRITNMLAAIQPRNNTIFSYEEQVNCTIPVK